MSDGRVARGAGELQAFALQQRQPPREGGAGLRHLGQRQHLVDPLRALGLLEAAAEHRGDLEVVEHAHVGERARHLVGAGQAEPDAGLRRRVRDVHVVERNGAGVERQGAGEQGEQRRLARAVRADDAEDLAFLDLEADVVCNDQRAERLREPAHREHDASHYRGPRVRWREGSRGTPRRGRARRSVSHECEDLAAQNAVWVGEPG